jgi:hypothetical protein
MTVGVSEESEFMNATNICRDETGNNTLIMLSRLYYYLRHDNVVLYVRSKLYGFGKQVYLNKGSKSKAINLRMAIFMVILV